MKKSFFSSSILGFSMYALMTIGVFVPTEVQARSYSNMGCYDLWYARNSIFANKGQCFESSKAIRAFGRRCYSPYGRLNSWEKSQVSDIKYWERRKGCSGGYVSRPSYSRGKYARVSGIRWNDTLAVRSGPSTRYRRIGNLPPDATSVQILECSRKWCRIRYGNITGWAYNQYLRQY